MSYDLCFWRQERPVTANQAEQIYLYLLGNSESEYDIRADDRVVDFHTAMMERFPALEGLDDPDAEASPWNITPWATRESVIVCMGYTHAHDTVPVLTALAEDHGLVCFNPQSGEVHNPTGIVETGRPRLSFRDGGIVDDPDPAKLRALLESLSNRNWYACLDREPDHFVQVGIGKHAGGLAEGRFAMEYRALDADRLVRVVTTDFDEVVALFERFASGDDDLLSVFDWEPGFVLGLSRRLSPTDGTPSARAGYY